MKTKSGSYRRSSPRRKPLTFLDYCTNFKLDKVIRKDKHSNKAYRVMFIRVGGVVVVKNKRRYSFSEYGQKMALLAKYASRVIDLNNIAQHSEDYQDLHYLFEEAIWEYVIPEGHRKIVGIGESAYAIRPFVTKWRIGFYPVASGFGDKGWSNLKLGVFSSYDLALRALAAVFPTLSYFDTDAITYVQQHLEKVKTIFRRKQETKETILKNIEKLEEK